MVRTFFVLDLTFESRWKVCLSELDVNGCDVSDLGQYLKRLEQKKYFSQTDIMYLCTSHYIISGTLRIPCQDEYNETEVQQLRIFDKNKRLK